MVEVGGPGTLARSIVAARQGGEIGMIGALTSGGEINPVPAMRKGLVLRGIYVGSRQMFEAMNRAIAAHRIEPVIDRVQRGSGGVSAPDWAGASGEGGYPDWGR